MQGKPLTLYWVILILLLGSSISIPVLTIADDTIPSAPQAGNQIGIYDGSIPSGEGIVSIKATSGKLYQIPAMSPLGVIQALAGTDIIDTYKVGDELIVKMGLLTLDGINGYPNSGDNSWFVLVNDKKLQDYLLPKEDALNTFKLKNGDVILFAYGNPTKPTGEASRTLKITIGAQSDSVTTPIATIASVPTASVLPEVPTAIPTVESTGTEKQVEPSEKNQINLNQTVQKAVTVEPTPSTSDKKESDPNQPVFEGEDTKEQVTTEPTPTSSDKKESDPNQPVFEGEEPKDSVTAEPTQETSDKKEADPNKPVFEGEEPKDMVTAEPTSSTSGKKEADPNQPVFEGEEPKDTVTAEPTPSTSGKKETDPNQPVIEGEEPKDTVTVEPTPTPEERDIESTEKTDADNKTESDTKPGKNSSGQDVIYTGTLPLPSGMVNLTAESGMEYNDVSGNTPLGLLQTLLSEGKINSMSFSDKAMNKGGILSFLSINDYPWGEEAWFVKVNDLILKDYANPGTEGFNVRILKPGDKVTYFYGKLDQTPDTAKAIIEVTIE